MPITSVKIDRGSPTLTIVADFAVPKLRFWDAYADPRQVELLWGPPTYPAKFTRHDMFEGGRSHYAMTGPGGDVSRGYWVFTDVQVLDSFEVVDGFCTDEGVPNPDLPTTRVSFAFEDTPNGSRLTSIAKFNSSEELEQLLAMGMEEGMRQAMGQIDSVVTDNATFAASQPALVQLLDDRRVRTSRVIAGTVDAVWAAHHDSKVVPRWLTADGWSMPECVTAAEVGERFRFVWRDDASGDQFQATGEVLESSPPRREVTTEVMTGTGIPDDAPETLNELTLTPLAGGTLVCFVITYPAAATREAVLATGMIDGMEFGYQRLDALLRIGGLG